LLGFVDDMLDLQWRYKLIYPFFIAIPMACNYYGPTSVVFTYPITIFIESIDFGTVIFSIYIILLGIYCTNTINIYAGINGLEVGQSIVAAASLLIIFSVKAFKEQGLKENYYYSIYLLVTFLGNFYLILGASLALLKKNAYPSQVFIGDTYCYFAGIVLCLSAIMGNLYLILR
jgi:UDP-N-acetylglucosamine--dolichyl-phosphate N-acetylglucosaminephosphotransferase